MKLLRATLERSIKTALGFAAEFDAEGKTALACKFSGRADGLETALALLDGYAAGRKSEFRIPKSATKKS